MSDEDLIQIAQSLVEKAKSGDVAAAKELLDRCLGKSKATLAVEKHDPAMTIEEIDKQIQLLVTSDPSLINDAVESIGMKLLPVGEGPPNA